MSFRANVVSRGIHSSCRFYLTLVLFCHVVDSSTPLTLSVGMTYGGTFVRIRQLFLECCRPYCASSVRAAPCQLPQWGSFCTGLLGAWFTGTPQGSSQNLPQRGRGTARRRWMRGGTALNIVGTMGAEAETFLRIRLQFLERFRLPRPSSVRAAPCQLPQRGSFCTVVSGVGIYR